MEIILEVTKKDFMCFRSPEERMINSGNVSSQSSAQDKEVKWSVRFRLMPVYSVVDHRTPTMPVHLNIAIAVHVKPSCACQLELSFFTVAVTHPCQVFSLVSLGILRHCHACNGVVAFP